MNIRKLFPSKYVTAEDLGQRKARVTIREVRVEAVAGHRKPVIAFERKAKALLLNRTNAMAIAAMYGNETDDWKGKTVVLYAALTTFKGEQVPCVRIRRP